jgi:O-antigen/teichoic acid export membrane protein
MFFIGFSLIISKELIVLILGEKYRAASYILPFLIFMPIMYTISETTVIGLVFKKKSNIQIIVVTLACLTNIIGNIILVPLYAGKGAAISTGISYIVFFFARTYFAGRYYYVNWHLTRFVIITALAVAYSLYSTFFQYNIFSVIGYIIAVVLLFVLYHDAVKEILFLSKNVLNSIKNRFCFS